ncbi:MAG: hypothetical protein Ct9H300mP31_14940 [Acidimicrobiaceae bacterium]|nr:MAG: hypothetical protein Ct9H300mP31_14940 [Acidimicrobiaceae bacterium]
MGAGRARSSRISATTRSWASVNGKPSRPGTPPAEWCGGVVENFHRGASRSRFAGPGPTGSGETRRTRGGGGPQPSPASTRGGGWTGRRPSARPPGYRRGPSGTGSDRPRTFPPDGVPRPRTRPRPSSGGRPPRTAGKGPRCVPSGRPPGPPRGSSSGGHLESCRPSRTPRPPALGQLLEAPGWLKNARRAHPCLGHPDLDQRTPFGFDAMSQPPPGLGPCPPPGSQPVHGASRLLSR